jgi:choline monooxygenase
MGPFEINGDIRRAKTLDTGYYKEPQYFAADKERIFSPSWQYIGHTDMVPDPGTYHPVELLPGYVEEPLLLSRDKSGVLHCL